MPVEAVSQPLSLDTGWHRPFHLADGRSLCEYFTPAARASHATVYSSTHFICMRSVEFLGNV